MRSEAVPGSYPQLTKEPQNVKTNRKVHRAQSPGADETTGDESGSVSHISDSAQNISQSKKKVTSFEKQKSQLYVPESDFEADDQDPSQGNTNDDDDMDLDLDLDQDADGRSGVSASQNHSSSWNQHSHESQSQSQIQRLQREMAEAVRRSPWRRDQGIVDAGLYMPAI